MRNLETKTKDEQRAMDHFGLALEVFSESQYPFSWATTNLWLAKIASTRLSDAVEHTEIDQRESPSTMVAWVQLLKQAQDSLHRALQVFSPTTAPQSWADAKMLTLSYQFGSIQEIRDVIDALDRSRRLHPSARSPLRWAEIHCDFATALLDLYDLVPERDGLQRAVEACTSALCVLTPDETPWHWARIQKTLGRAMLAMGKHLASAAQFEDAIEAYRSANALTRRDVAPEHWADCVTSIGEATLLLGQHRDGARKIMEAVSLLQDALETYDQAHHRMGSFKVLPILCRAYVALSPMVEDKQSVADAVVDLEQRSKSLLASSNVGWPTTQLKAALGEAIAEVSTGAGDPTRLQRGLAMLQEAVDESADSRELLTLAELRIALAAAYVGRLLAGAGSPADLEPAAENLASAKEFLHPEIQPFLWFAYVAVSSSIAILVSHTKLQGDPMDTLRQAEANVRRALDYLLADQSPVGRGMTLLLLGSLLERQAELPTGSDRAQEVEDAFGAAATLISHHIAPGLHKAAVLGLERSRGAS